MGKKEVSDQGTQPQGEQNIRRGIDRPWLLRVNQCLELYGTRVCNEILAPQLDHQKKSHQGIFHLENMLLT